MPGPPASHAPVRARRRTLGLLASAALVLASLLLAPRVEAATTDPRGTLLATAAPEYRLEGFRWNRSVVPVYYSWDGGACVFAGNNFTSNAPTIDSAVLLSTLQASIAEINEQARGGITLQLAGPASRAELCSTISTRPIVIGFGTISSTGQALSFGTVSRGSYAAYTAARVFISTANSFFCPTPPEYRDLQHTMTHELLHAVGIGHSDERPSLMAPTFVGCQSSHVMQADDVAALNALYEPTLPPATAPVVTSTPTPVPTAPPVASPAASGAFVTPVRFSSSGQALAVFAGGSVEALEVAARGAGASGAWVQDATGTYRLLVVDGPSFLREQFRSIFPAGLPPSTAATLVR